MGTKWCVVCGGEFIDTVEMCPDDEVVLVDERPDTVLAEEGDGQVAYDLASWAAESRAMLSQLVEGESVPHAWEGTTLVVPGAFENVVDNLVDHVEVTTLPSLDPEADKVAYDVSDWPDQMVSELQSVLDREHLPYEFDAEGDIVTLAEHEARVEALMDAIEFPDQLDVADDEDEVGDLDAADVLSDLFVATDRMKRNARDHEGVLSFVSASDGALRMPIPFGFAPVTWTDICNQVRSLRDLLEAEDSADEDIEAQAADLRNTLRDYV